MFLLAVVLRFKVSLFTVLVVIKIKNETQIFYLMFL